MSRLRFNVSQMEYCPFCQNEGWVWLIPERFRYHDTMPATGCRWCEEGDRLLRRFPWLVKDYHCEDVDLASIDLEKRHILRPDEIHQLERMLRSQPGVEGRPDRPAFVQPMLGSLGS